MELRRERGNVCLCVCECVRSGTRQNQLMVRDCGVACCFGFPVTLFPWFGSQTNFHTPSTTKSSHPPSLPLINYMNTNQSHTSLPLFSVHAAHFSSHYYHLPVVCVASVLGNHIQYRPTYTYAIDLHIPKSLYITKRIYTQQILYTWVKFIMFLNLPVNVIKRMRDPYHLIIVL